jgi:O-antigen/teichoic acid export membrane protein
VLASNFGVQLVGVVRGFAIPFLVSPSQYGIWRLVLIVWQYGAYLHLGTFALLNREMPEMIVKGKQASLIPLRQTAFWGTMAVSAIVVGLLVTFNILIPETARPEQTWAMGIASVGLIAQQVSLYVLVLFRVESRFGEMSMQGFIEAFAGLLLMIPLVLVIGVPGLALGLTLASIVATALFARLKMFDPPRLHIRAFVRQAKAGAPLSSLPFLNATIASVGQVVTASALGIEAAGLYGIGLVMGMIVYAVPNAVGMVLYPRYLTSYATESDHSEVGRLVRRSVKVTSAVCISAVCLGAVLLQPVYRTFFPRYVAALSTSYILMAMMPFVAYALVLQNALIALRKHTQVIAIQGAAVVLSAVLSVVGAFAFRSVVWVAIGVMVANILSGLATLWLGFSATRIAGRSPTREIVAELAPVILLGTATLAMIKAQNSFPNKPSLGLVGAEFFVVVALVTVFGLKTFQALKAEDR